MRERVGRRPARSVLARDRRRRGVWDDPVASEFDADRSARWRTEHSLQRARWTALALAIGITWSLTGWSVDPRWLIAVVLLTTIIGVDLALRRVRGRRALVGVGWCAFLGDAATIALALQVVNSDPADPIWAITALLAIESAVRWRTRGALLGGLGSAVLAGWWATMAYAAEGRALSAESIVFRGAVLLVLALPVGLLIDQLRREQQRVRQLAELATALLLVVDDRGRVLTANPEAGRVLGRPERELRGLPWQVLLPDCPDLGQLEALTRDGGHHLAAVADPGQGTRWLELTATRAGDRDLLHLIAREVTVRVEAEQQLRASAQRFRALFESNTDAVLGLDVDGVIRHANPAAVGLLRPDASAESAESAASGLLGERLLDLLPTGERAAAARELLATRSASRPPRPLPIACPGPAARDGELTLLPTVVDGRVTGMFAMVRDVTDARRREARLRFAARHDALTGLPNRSALEQDLEDRRRREQPFGLLYVDVDDFKPINDGHGHAAGDEVLRAIAARLRGAVRDSDTPYRLAGDEFCVIVAPADEPVLRGVAERVTEALQAPVTVADHVLPLSASVGTSLADPQEEVAELLDRADAAMYRVKHRRRGPGPGSGTVLREAAERS